MSTITHKKLLTAEEFFLLPPPPGGAQQQLVRGRSSPCPEDCTGFAV